MTARVISAERFSRSNSISRSFFATSASIFAVSRLKTQQSHPARTVFTQCGEWEDLKQISPGVYPELGRRGRNDSTQSLRLCARCVDF